MKLFFLLFAVLFSFCSYADSDKNKIKKIVIFGDSLSDNGNYFKESKGSQNPMPLPPYYHGRATNGMVWAEQLSAALDAKLENYAHLGALTFGFNARYPMATSMVAQLDEYLNNIFEKNKDLDKTLFVIWAGANNIFTMNFKEPWQTSKKLWRLSGDLKNSVKKLKEKGARYVMVANLPDLGNIALTSDVDSYKNMKWLLSSLTNLENYFINKRVLSLADHKSDDDFKIIYFDVHKILKEFTENAKKYGFKNTANSCYPGVPAHLPSPNVACKNPQDYLFWDLVHPSAKAHCFTAIKIQNLLAKEIETPKPHQEQSAKCLKL
jgi:phospholipase/lecithinase/hemolysin